jgi:hypothetical protein
MYLAFAEKGITFASGALTLQTAPPARVAAPRGESPAAVSPAAGGPPRLAPEEVPALVK